MLPIRHIGIEAVVEFDSRQQQQPSCNAEGSGQRSHSPGREESIHSGLNKDSEDDPEGCPYGTDPAGLIEGRTDGDTGQDRTESIKSRIDGHSTGLEYYGCSQ